MTRAIRIQANGGPEVLDLVDVDPGEPSHAEARVRHTAIGLNFIDTYHRTGLYPLALPTGIGMEAAGIVEAIGDGVHDIAVGQRVAYAGGPPGAYAEARCIAADRLVPLPADISDEVAASSLLKGMTVEYLVRRVRPVGAGDVVLWHAAAGGVGLLACQWLAHLGVETIGTVGSDAKADLARAHGCAHTVVYTREDFVAFVRAHTGGAGVPVVFDSVGKATFMGSLDCLRPRGMYVGFGNASGKPEPFDMGILAAKGSLFLTRPTLMDYTRSRADLLASAAALFDVIRAGAVEPRIHQRFALAEAARAHRELERRATTGSTILVP
jgi:NADPH2:quinone reductase